MVGLKMKKKALWKDFFIEIKKSLNRFLSIFLIVALGVAFFAGIRATNPDMRITADYYYDESRLMDIKVLSTMGITKEDVQAISEVTGVEEAEPYYSTHVVCDVNGNELVLEVMSATQKLNKITVTKGRMPATEQEVLVDQFFVDHTGYDIGATFHVASGTDSPLSEELNRNEFTIVGIGTTANYLSFQRGTTTIGTGKVDSFIVMLPEVFAAEVYTGVYVVAKNTLQMTAYTDAYDEKVEETVNKIKEIADRQSQKRYDDLYQKADSEITRSKQELSQLQVPKWYVLDRKSIEAYVEYEQNADRIGAIGKVFPVIFFLVAALISLTTMTRMVEEERVQIGTLKALGYSKGSIATKYLLYALLATLGGSITGALVGLKVLPMVIITAYKILYRNIPKVLTPFHLYYASLATIFAVLCVGLATFFACHKELMAKPAELMRPEAPKIGKRVFLERFPFLWKRLSFTWKATIRNLLRYKKRFLMTIIGIGGCMALLLVGFGLKDSIFVIYTRQFDEIILYDASVSMDKGATQSQKKELDQVIKNKKEFTSNLKIRNSTVEISFHGKTKAVTLFVPEDTSLFKNYINIRSRIGHIPYELEDHGVVLTEQIAKRLGIKKGDIIAIKEGDNQAEALVTAISENYMSHYVFVSPSLYQNLFHKPVENNEYLLLLSDTASDVELLLGNEILNMPAANGIFYIRYYRNLLDNVLVSLNIVVWVLIISAGALAFVVLYNLNNININERRRELATIKVLGFFSNEVAAYVYRENIVLTAIGAAFGVIFGIILHRYVIVTVEIELVMFGRNINSGSYLYSILLTFLFSAFVNVMMYFKLKKINMVESLKSVE
jgi:putative ABC transport system permease protein